MTAENLPRRSKKTLKTLSSNPSIRYFTMAKKIARCLKRPLGQEDCIIELQGSVKPEQHLDVDVVKAHENEAHLDDSDHMEPLKLFKKPSLKYIYGVGVLNVLSLMMPWKQKIIKEDAITHILGENGCVILRMQGKKERLKHLIKATLFKSCIGDCFSSRVGSVMGLCEGKPKARIITVPQKAVKFKKDGILSKRILQEQQANELLAEIELMKRLYHVNEKLLLPGMVEEIHRDVVKYWLRRYTLFSRFDDGIKLDEEGLFSVTPEEIAKHQAAHCGHSSTIIDAFTGVGGNAIQFARMNMHVIAIDIDSKKIEYARHNAGIYGVADRIDFIVGDFFQLAPSLKADVVFLSPPWGGPEYIRAEKYDIETMLKPKNGFTLFQVALSVAPSVAFFLPRTVDEDQLAKLSWLSNPPLPYEIEKNYVQNELKAVTAYYGKIAY